MVMPLILKNKHDRFVSLCHRSALRSTSELVDQLQDQLHSERAQHRFDLAQKEQPLEAPPLGAERSGSP
jgi:hypothetical protein